MPSDIRDGERRGDHWPRHDRSYGGAKHKPKKTIGPSHAAMLVIAAFGFAFLNRPHVYGAGSLFLVSFTLLTVALVLFAQEIRLAIKDNERIG